MKLVIMIEPMGTVRTTRGMINRIRWKKYTLEDKRVMKVIEYLQYKERLSWAARQKHKDEPITGPIKVNLTFYMPMPESWSGVKKRRMEGAPHTTKPDRDNLEKGVCDALNKIVWKDDGQVCDGRTRKFYSNEPRIEIEICAVGALESTESA